MSDFRIERIRDGMHLESLREDWTRLAGDGVMRSWDWHRAWWSGFGEGRELYVLVAWQGNTVCGILPLALHRSLFYGRQLTLLGGDKASSDDMSLLCGDGDRTKVAQAFAAWLSNAQGDDSWDRLQLDGVRPSDPAWHEFRAACEANQLLVETRPSASSWCIPLEGSWDGYLKTISKRARKILRDLDRDYVQTGRAKMELAGSLPEARQALERIAAMHEARWRERGIAGCFSFAPFRRMCETALERLWPAGTFQLATVQLDGSVVAGAIVFDRPGSHEVYLVGMDPDKADLRPGFLLNVLNLQRALAEHKTRLDLLRGDEAYKSRLGGVATTQERWVVSSPRWLSRARHAAYSAGVRMRDWMVREPAKETSESNSAG